MTTTEALKPSLTREIRKRVYLNQDGDDGGRWSIYGFTDIKNYESDFSKVLNGSTIHDLLKNRQFPVVIDLMAPSGVLATLFERFPDRQKLGLAISLSDLRNYEEKERDERLNVKQIRGDLIRSSTWDEIEEKLQGRKAGLIMERALGGLHCIPSNSRFYAMLLNKAWSLLSKNNGVLIAQIPIKFETETGKWISGIINANNIDASIDRVGVSTELMVIKLVKTPNSPEQLPFSAIKE